MEKNFSIKTTLKSENKPTDQTKETLIDAIPPDEKKTIVIKDLKPVKEGTVNLLTVTVGPVPNEKNPDNNLREYKFIIEQP